MAELTNTNETVQGQDNVAETETTAEARTYSEAEFQSEVDRRVTQALRTAEKKNSEKVKEAEKLAKMSAEEQYHYQLEQREKAIAEKEHALAMAENRNEACKILAERGLSLRLVDFVVDESADVMSDRIKLLDREFKACVKAEVEKRLGGSSTKAATAPGEINKDTFKSMSLSEKQALYNSDPALYASLSGH